jgi:hypothetical protein
MLMTKIPLIVRKAIDFDVWFNKKVLKWNDEKNFRWVLSGAQDDAVREYIKYKFLR